MLAPAPSPPLLYLGPDAVAACDLRAADIVPAVASAFRAKAAGRARSGSGLRMRTGNSSDSGNFSAKGGVLDDEGFAVLKWYGYIPHNQDRRGLPDFSPVLILSDAENGLPLALIDGHWLSAMRTAALSCVAARVLARPDAVSVGFVACGAQAHSHLEALHQQFSLQRIVAYSRSVGSAEKLAEHARALGLQASVTTDPHAAVTDMGIVVTSVPREAEPRAFLDARRVSPGTYVAMPCMGCSWDPRQLNAFDLLATDDYDPATQRSTEKLAFEGALHADLGELLARSHAWAPSPQRRSAFIFAGSGLADAAAATVIYRRAMQRGLGQQLGTGVPFPIHNPTASNGQ